MDSKAFQKIIQSGTILWEDRNPIGYLQYASERVDDIRQRIESKGSVQKLKTTYEKKKEAHKK